MNGEIAELQHEQAAVTSAIQELQSERARRAAAEADAAAAAAATQTTPSPPPAEPVRPVSSARRKLNTQPDEPADTSVLSHASPTASHTAQVSVAHSLTSSNRYAPLPLVVAVLHVGPPCVYVAS